MCNQLRIELEFQSNIQLPPLAWLAHGSPGSTQVQIIHGTQVEVRGNWFCEAIWDGPFKEGQLDQTDMVFGSGGRVRDSDLIFVSSGTTVDRLISLHNSDGFWVSNSLPLLLAAANAQLDRVNRNYHNDFLSIVKGLGSYRRTLDTSVGPVHLTYYHNLRWDGQELTTWDKPFPKRGLEDFDGYQGFLSESLAALSANMRSRERSYPYQMLGTISTGYDSPTIVTLARDHGLREAITFDTARGGSQDSGHAIATKLDLNLTTISTDAWRDSDHADIYFLSADAKGEDVYLYGARDLLRGRVLLTGFHGDKVWDKHTPEKYLGDELVRGDQSGLSVSEFRLHAGFLNCAVPFMAARQIRDIHAISNSPQMKPWNVPSRYNRPICRRIVEMAGVPREMFGMEKKAASVLLAQSDSFLSDQSLEDFRSYMADNASGWRERGLAIPRERTSIGRLIHRSGWTVGQCMQRAGDLSPRILKPLKSAGFRLCKRTGHHPLFEYLFPWAVDRMRARYLDALRGSEAEQSDSRM